MQNASNMAGTGGGSKSGGGDRIERNYQKQLEHILLHPDTYIGTVEHTTELMWIYNEVENKMVQEEINFVPGLYKIFDEILVNAAGKKDKNMTCIRIVIDTEKNSISIRNNGKGIPVVKHKDGEMYEPTMIFGHLLTSSNYNDEEENVTGGCSEYGVKLCNIFSTSFTVETAFNKSFRQIWNNNMTQVSKPKIKPIVDSASDYTKITFSPDLSKFKMERLDDDIVALMKRRAYDVAASRRVDVFLNNKKLPVKNFENYIDLYLKEYHDEAGKPLKAMYHYVNERWEVAVVAPSERGYYQVS